MKHFVIYTMLFGVPVPSEPHFTNESACVIYLRGYTEQVVEAFKLVCVDDSPPMCQGEVCE
jgi:hypothetical protein